MLELWERTLKSLQDQMTAQHFDAWLRPIRATLDGDTLVLKVPNRFAKEWLTNNYLDMIRSGLRVSRGHEVEVRLDLDAHEEGAALATETLIPPPLVAPPRSAPGLNTKYNFHNFVV